MALTLTVVSFTDLYSFIPLCTLLFHTAQYYTAPHCYTTQYHTIKHCTLVLYTILYYLHFSTLYGTFFLTILHCTTVKLFHSKLQYYTLY